LWHAALFYRSAAQFEDAVCRFAEAGARAGAAVLIACTKPAIARLRARLDGIGNQVTWADIAVMGVNPGRLICAIAAFASRHPGRPVWCVQQAAWPSRPEQELWEVLRHEALTNLALAGDPVRVLCPYHADLPAPVISCAETTHPVITGNGHWQHSPSYRDTGSPVPPECEQPLPPPPAGASVLPYRDDLGAVRRLVARHAGTAGLPPSRASDLVIAVSELTANTLVHTSRPGTMTVWTAGNGLTCQIHDTGHIEDPLAGLLRPGLAADRGGRGLWLVHQLCDLVQVRTGPDGTIIRVHMRIAR